MSQSFWALTEFLMEESVLISKGYLSHRVSGQFVTQHKYL
jgi:hypothetical protein